MRQRLPALLPALALAAALLATPAARPAAATGRVVGGGTPESCTAAALVAAVAEGETVTFNCGPSDATIRLASPLAIEAPSVTIDGGGKITLEGAGGRLIEHRSYGNIGGSTLTLRGLRLVGGRASGSGASADAAYAANGAAVRSVFQAANPAFKPTLIVERVTFTDNVSALAGVPGGRDAYDYGGGAIYSQGGAVIVRDSEFSQNRAANGSGGAIHILQSSLTIERSSFEGNSAIGARPEDSLGGAIYIDGLGADSRLFRLAASRFADNQAYNSGGAIYLNMYEDVSRAEIVDSLFERNRVIGGARAQGGAIGGGGSSLGRAGTGNPQIQISGSLFSDNSARKTAGAGGNSTEDGSGGALAFPQRARLSIVNSSFSGNIAHGTSFNANGGALYVANNSDPFEIAFSSFAGNQAGWVGGAIVGTPGRLRGSLFSGNSAANGGNDWKIRQTCADPLESQGGNMQFPGLTANQFNAFNDRVCAAGIAVADPRLGPLADNGGPTPTMAIAADSPARDAAGASCPATDQRGVGRPRGGSCDIGAVERIVALEADVTLLRVGAAQRSITLRGDGFGAASKALVGGQERPTSFVNGSALRVTLSAADVDSAGRLTLSVAGSALGSVVIVVSADTRQIYLPSLGR
jgi:hypothetical protein